MNTIIMLNHLQGVYLYSHFLYPKHCFQLR